MAGENAAAATAAADPATGAASAISEEEVSALLEKDGRSEVRPYDFMSQRVNRTQLPMLEVVSKSCADRMAASLSGLLGRDEIGRAHV